MRRRRKTPRQLQVERTLRDIERAHGLPVEESPPGLVVALVTEPVAPDDTPQSIVRPGYVGYRDAPVSLGPAQGGKISNDAQVQFPPCTGGSSVIVGYAVIDGAKILLHGTVDPVSISPTQSPAMFPPNHLIFTMS